MAQHNEDFVLDAWSPLSHKRVLGGTSVLGRSWVAPSWVGKDHERRIAAYKLLDSYTSNVARHFLATTSDEDMGDHREYGDASLIVQQVLAALIGDDQQVVVEGADDYDPELPDDASDDDRAANEAARLAWDAQEYLRQWAADERLGLKIIETERNSIKLGDGVYVLGWSERKKRAHLRVFDPGFYFPVLDDGDEDDYPRRVHIAWEIEDESGGRVRRRVRRITWELGPIEPVPDTEAQAAVGVAVGSVLREGDRLLPDGRIARRYPWQPEGEEPSTVTCYMTDATWDLDEPGPAGVDDFTGSKAQYAVNEDGEVVDRLDLRLDFLPVVHVPNTVALLNHFGQSTLATVLQILDDVQAADTDLSRAASTSATPPIAVGGAPTGGNVDTYGPGQVFHTGEHGRMDVLDTTKGVEVLIKLVEFLLKRLSVNSRVPEAVLGRVSPGEIEAGIILALSFGPLQSMVKEMRLVRDEKYPLVLKFVQRMTMAGNAEALPAGEVFPARVAFGSYLPVDRAQAVAEVTGLLNAHAISLETAISMLIEAGFAIDDAREEVRRIREEDFESANAMLDATGDPQAVRDRLGLKGPPPEPPAPEPVPVGGGGAGAGGAGAGGGAG